MTQHKTDKASRAHASALAADELEVFKQALLQKRDLLSRSQASHLSGLHSPEKHHLADLEEMASDTVDTDSLCEIMDIGSSTIEQIDAALARIEDGTYGCCSHCSQVIPRARLDALPFAELCVSCQRKREQGLLVADDLSSEPEESEREDQESGDADSEGEGGDD
jgi:DnaK suppressor protein